MLRWHGYRSSKRDVVFQLLPHTLGLGPEVWRVLCKCHDLRNLREYEGDLNIDERASVRAGIAVEPNFARSGAHPAAGSDCVHQRITLKSRFSGSSTEIKRNQKWSPLTRPRPASTM